MITFEDVKNNEEINAYIRAADKVMDAIGYTEHSFAHVTRAAEQAADILDTLGYSERTRELARIAGYMHDIGNAVNRHEHALTGAVMAFRILDNMGMSAEEIAKVVSAIGNHDEGTGAPVNEIAAALILADKGDVRRSRVRPPRRTCRGHPRPGQLRGGILRAQHKPPARRGDALSDHRHHDLRGDGLL